MATTIYNLESLLLEESLQWLCENGLEGVGQEAGASTASV